MSARVAPRRFSRRRLLAFRMIERACRALGGRAFYRRRYLAPGRLVLRREDIPLPAHADRFDGYRIAVLSDFHAGSFLGAGDLAHALAEVERWQPDAVCLLGDFIVHAPEEFLRIADDLARLRARDGVFGVFGNHDYRGRREGEMVARLARTGVRFLRNASVRVGRFGADAPALVFVGIEDAEEARVLDVAAARRGLRPGDIEVALSHNPRAAPAFATRPENDNDAENDAASDADGGRGALLVLAGHTHGGQIDWPLLRRLGPPHPGLRVELGGTTLLVTRGLGVVGAPLRIGSPAEVLFVTLRAQDR